MVRANCAEVLGIEASQLRVISSEIGGGFGGKTTTFIEPVALALSRKSGKPVSPVFYIKSICSEAVFRMRTKTPYFLPPSYKAAPTIRNYTTMSIIYLR